MPGCPLDNAVASFLQASRKRSMSASVVLQPRLTRTAPRSSARRNSHGGKDMGGLTLPDEQAAPDETATPSRSKAMTAVSAFMPSTANKRRIRQPLGVGAENHGARRDRPQPGFERCRATPACARPRRRTGRAPPRRQRRMRQCRRRFRCRRAVPRSWPPPRISGSGM